MKKTIKQTLKDEFEIITMKDCITTNQYRGDEINIRGVFAIIWVIVFVAGFLIPLLMGFIFWSGGFGFLFYLIRTFIILTLVSLPIFFKFKEDEK